MSDELKEQMKQQVKKILDELSKFWEYIRKIKEDGLSGIMDMVKNVDAILGIFMVVAAAIEQVADGFDDEVGGREKREVAAELLDEYFKFENIFLEIVDRALFKLLISLAVSVMNRDYGDDEWPDAEDMVDELPE